MKIKVKVWVLSYASVLSDGELFVDTLGVYDNHDDATSALKDNVRTDINDGDEAELWNIGDDNAEYKDDMSCEYKAYSIKEL